VRGTYGGTRPRAWRHAQPPTLRCQFRCQADRLVKSGEYERLLGKDRYTKLRHRASGLQVDLFTVRPPAQWGVIHTIRTGPAAYSQWLVTEARRRGFHVREGALHRGSLGCGSVPCEVIETPEERDLFEALGMRWPQPVERGRM
jgi:DNA polymerase/3'-5' exonuclease PolX